MQRNVLIVEDNDSHMKHICNIIDGLGYTLNVYKAYNIKDAYYIASSKDINLFLIDIILDSSRPDNVDGLDFVSEIRNNERYRFIPVIFLTSLEDPGLHAYKDLHCFGYVEKPFKKEQVEGLISAALKYPIENKKSDVLFFRKDGIVYTVKSNEIVFFESTNRVMKIYCRNDYLEVGYKTISDVLEMVSSNDFIQCSRTTVVNKQYIDKIDFTNRYISMKCINMDVEIGISWKKRFREMLGDI